MKKSRRLGNAGFSLVELIIVIAIMAILAGALAPALIKYIEKSRKTADVNTAQEIGKAAERASYSEQVESVAGSDYTVGECFADSASVISNQGVTDEDGNSYNVACVCMWTRNTNQDALYNNSSSQGKALSKGIADELGSDKITMKCKKTSAGVVNTYFVFRRADTNTVEVWVGDSSPLYQLYPSVSSEYKN